MKLEEVFVLINAKIDPYKRAMEDMRRHTNRANKDTKKSISDMTSHVENQTSKIRTALSRLGKVASIAVLLAGMYKVSKYSTQMALEVSASINQIRRTMGESSQTFLKWSESSAIAYNLSTADATKFGAVYSNLFSNFIKDSDQLSAYTVQMLKTSSIISSATGRSMEDVMDRIRSGMLGSTEAIEDLGINVNVSMLESTRAFQQFANGRSWAQLDFNTQQAIRMMAILEQANTKFGDKLMQGPTTSLAQFNALMKNVVLNIGNALLPVLEAVMPVLNAFAIELNKATKALAVFMQLLFNKKAKTENISKNVSGLGKGLSVAGAGAENLDVGLDKAGKKAQKLKKEMTSLMGFDEINLLNKADDYDLGEDEGLNNKTSGVTLPNIGFESKLNEDDFSYLQKYIDKIKEIMGYLGELGKEFKLGFKDSIDTSGLDRIKQSLRGIKESIFSIFEDGEVSKAADRWARAWAFSFGQISATLVKMAIDTVALIAESFNKSLAETSPDIKSWIIKNLEIDTDIAQAVGNIAKGICDVFHDVFTSESASNIGADIISQFTYAFMGATTIIHGLVRDVFTGVEKIITDNKELVSQALVGTLEAVEPIFETFKNATKDFFDGLVGLYEAHLKPLIDSFFEGISMITSKVLEAYQTYMLPVIQEFSEKYAATYNEYIKPAMDSLFELLGKVMDIIKVLWENILAPLLGFLATQVIKVLSPIMKFIGDVVIVGIKMISTTIKFLCDVLSGIIDFLVGVFTGDWDRAWKGIEKIFTAIWNFIMDFVKITWEAVKSIFTVALGLIKSIVEGAFTGIKNIIITIFTEVKDFISRTWDNIKDVVARSIANIYKDVSEKCAGIFNAVKDWFGKIPGKIREVWDGVIDYLRKIDLFEIGKDIMRGLLNGIRDIGNMIWDEVCNLAQSIEDAFMDMLDIHSPSRVMRKLGGYIGEGVALGIGDETETVLKESRQMGLSVINGFESNNLDLSKSIDISTPFKSSMKEVFNSAMSADLVKNSASGGDIIIQIGDTEFGRFAISKINEEQERAGMTLLRI